MENLRVEQMELDDVEGVFQIEKNCFQVPWSKEAFTKEITDNKLALYFVLKSEAGEIYGYMGMWLIIEEAHITNIAVDKIHQGHGYGTFFLREVIKEVERMAIKRMTLEVRKSNIVAINLYEKMGFISYGIRPKYYQDNNEDAVIMWKSLEEGEI